MVKTSIVLTLIICLLAGCSGGLHMDSKANEQNEIVKFETDIIDYSKENIYENESSNNEAELELSPAQTFEQNDILEIEVALYPTSAFSGTCYFVLNADGELTVEKGTRVGNDITQSPFIIKDDVFAYRNGKKQLSSSEISTIIDLANKVYDNEFGISDMSIRDGWEAQILYKDKVVKQDYQDYTQIKELVDEFINASPIEINFREWYYKPL